MRTVLGIDAAWTTTQPSGVALIACDGDGWRLLAVESAYDAFYRRAQLAESPWDFDAQRLVNGATRLSGHRVTLVAADIPLSHQPITARRASDNAVSRIYGARYASTHTPSATRPGALADAMTAQFAALGYPLLTSLPVTTGLIEVYPHPALIELAAAPRRLPYKIGKTAKYWPGSPLADRRANLMAQWHTIVELLEAQIAGVREALPPPPSSATGRQLKAYEDGLDAVICAWVGACALDGKAIPLGDDISAIWVPAPSGLVGDIG